MGDLMRRYINLLEGKILPSLGALALPIMAASLIQMAYNLTDMIWIGRISADAVAAVGAAGMFMWLSNGLMTYASISVGFILTEFALLLTFSSSAFFANWRRSGKFLLWQAVNLLAVFSSLAVLVSSFVLLGWESTLPFVMGILAVNVVCMVLVFTPLLVVAGRILREGEQL